MSGIVARNAGGVNEHRKSGPMASDRWRGFDLSDALTALLRRVDPVPEAVRDAASSSLAWRDPEAALATLLRDAHNEATLPAIRGDGPRLLTFETGDTVVDLEITP